MINFNQAIFLKSVTDLSNAPRAGLPEILLVGRSNVGKSSFINGLTNHKKLAFSSSKPGHTRLLNYFEIDNKFYLIDSPGYGYANGGLDLDLIFSNTMNEYFKNAKYLKLVIILLDSRREINSDDIEIINYCLSNNINYIVVFTKVDKINQSEKSLLMKKMDLLHIDKSKICFTSILKTKTFSNVQSIIEKTI